MRGKHSLYCGFCGRNGRGRGNGLSIGSFESFQWALGHGTCPWLSGDWLRADGEWPRVWELIKEVVGVWTDLFAFEKHVLGTG